VFKNALKGAGHLCRVCYFYIGLLKAGTKAPAEKALGKPSALIAFSNVF
jgi:hypothetical protein